MCVWFFFFFWLSCIQSNTFYFQNIAHLYVLYSLIQCRALVVSPMVHKIVVISVENAIIIHICFRFIVLYAHLKCGKGFKSIWLNANVRKSEKDSILLGRNSSQMVKNICVIVFAQYTTIYQYHLRKSRLRY